MSFHAVPPFVLLDTIPKGYNNTCDFDPIMKIAFSHPKGDNPYLGVKFTPHMDLKFEDIPIGVFQVQSEFFIIPDKDITKRDKEIYNLAITAISNLNDLFSIDHDIPFVDGGKIFYNTPGFESVKKTIDISFMNPSTNIN